MKNSRTRLLFSSVSMLLVAVLSLSVATYAWFTATQTEASAKQLSAKTELDADYLLSWSAGTDADWQPELSLDLNTSQSEIVRLMPVSTTDCTNWFTTYSGATVITDLTNAEAEVQAKYFRKTEFYIKSTKGTSIATYVMNCFPYDFETYEELDYFRAALVVEGVNDNKPKVIYGNSYADREGLIDVLGGTSRVKISEMPTGSINLSGNTPQKITLYTWFEGEDPECVSDNAGKLVGVELSFSKAAGE